jgi:hypothetical protein
MGSRIGRAIERFPVYPVGAERIHDQILVEQGREGHA